MTAADMARARPAQGSKQWRRSRARRAGSRDRHLEDLGESRWFGSRATPRRKGDMAMLQGSTTREWAAGHAAELESASDFDRAFLGRLDSARRRRGSGAEGGGAGKRPIPSFARWTRRSPGAKQAGIEEMRMHLAHWYAAPVGTKPGLHQRSSRRGASSWADGVSRRTQFL